MAAFEDFNFQTVFGIKRSLCVCFSSNKLIIFPCYDDIIFIIQRICGIFMSSVCNNTSLRTKVDLLLGFGLHIIFVRKRCLRVTFPKSLRNLPTFSPTVNAKQIWIASRSHQSRRCARSLPVFQGHVSPSQFLKPDNPGCRFRCGKGRVAVQCEHEIPTSSWRVHVLSPVTDYSVQRKTALNESRGAENVCLCHCSVAR